MNAKSKSATTGETRPKVVVERTYRAPVEELWALWTTKEGFESWWGPEGFRVEVHALDARVGGALHYDMIAATPEMIEAMKRMGRPASMPAHARVTQLERHRRRPSTSLA